MELIASLLFLAGTAVCAVFLHVAAHDFIHHAPSISKSVVDRAVAFLPASRRGRYSEEWHSHLLECEGVIAKLIHALNCYGIALRVRTKIVLMPTPPIFEIEVVGFGSFRTNDPVSSLHLLDIFAQLNKAKEASTEQLIDSRASAFGVSKEAPTALRGCAFVLRKALEALEGNPDERIAYQIYLDGVPIDTEKLSSMMDSLLREHNAKKAEPE